MSLVSWNFPLLVLSVMEGMLQRNLLVLALGCQRLSAPRSEGLWMTQIMVYGSTFQFLPLRRTRNTFPLLRLIPYTVRMLCRRVRGYRHFLRVSMQLVHGSCRSGEIWTTSLG